LVTEEMLVHRDLRVEETPGRNHNFRVEVKGGPSYFLKQAPPDDVEDPLLLIEAELYRRVLEGHPWSQLEPFVPHFRLYDIKQTVLVTDLELGLSDVGGFGDEYSVLGLARVGEPLARALAACHRAAPGAGASDLEFLPRAAPGILGITCPHPSSVQYLSPAQIEVIHLLQNQSPIKAAFDETRAGWTATCLVHGDVKWTNVLVRVDAQSGRPAGVMLVDWELARLGDPAWDVGSVFHSYLAHSVLSAAIPEGSSSREAAEAMGAALSSFYDEVGAFWDTYASGARLSRGGGRPLLSQAIRCCIVRLVQSAYEWSQNETVIPGRAAAILQLAINMLNNAEDSRRVVLGGLIEHSSSNP
jgi:hypothetical protein